MRLTWPQQLVMLATLAMFAAAILDILQVIAPSDRVWIVVPIALLVANWLIMPGVAEIRRASRRD